MILDGRTIANHILEDLSYRVKILEETKNVQPHLAVVRVGDDEATSSYIRQKEKTAKQIGAVVSVYNTKTNITQQEIKEILEFLQTKGDIHGIILQLPMPEHINTEDLLMHIHPHKDVDGFRPNSPFVIPIATAILKLLEVPMMKETITTGNSFNEWLRSKHIVVVGKGKTGGQPVIDVLRERGADVHIIDSTTTNAKDQTLEADIIISAVGKPHVITEDMVKKDAILISIGMSMNDEGKFVGDYEPEDIKEKAEWYTPIPGGVGPVNVACLMENLVLATENAMKN